jgi:hypothetical protein
MENQKNVDLYFENKYLDQIKEKFENKSKNKNSKNKIKVVENNKDDNFDDDNKNVGDKRKNKFVVNSNKKFRLL